MLKFRKIAGGLLKIAHTPYQECRSGSVVGSWQSADGPAGACRAILAARQSVITPNRRLRNSDAAAAKVARRTPHRRCHLAHGHAANTEGALDHFDDFRRHDESVMAASLAFQFLKPLDHLVAQISAVASDQGHRQVFGQAVFLEVAPRRVFVAGQKVTRPKLGLSDLPQHRLNVAQHMLMLLLAKLRDFAR